MRRFTTIAAVCCLLAASGGCSDQQLRQVDRAAEAVQGSAPAAQELVQSPVGALAGEDAQRWGMIGVTTLSALAALWQKIRKDQAQRETAGVIASVDTLLGSKVVKDPDEAKELLKKDQGAKLATKVKAIKNS